MPNPPRALADESRAVRSDQEVDRFGDAVKSRTIRYWSIFSLALVLLLGGLWKIVPRASNAAPAPVYTSGHAALLRVYGEELPFEPRLSATGGRRRDAEDPWLGAGFQFSGDGLGARVRAEALIEQELAAHPAPEALAAAGVRRLLTGNPDEAIGVLEAARLARPDDPRILNDLAAAHLLFGRVEGRGMGLVTALSLTLRAVEIDPAGPEWRFNLALALEALHLELAARDAWESYLELDSKSTWAESARRHLDAFERETRWRGSEKAARRLQELDGKLSRERILDLSRRFPERLLDFAERELLISWARAVGRGDSESAKASLANLGHVARALGSSRGGKPLELTVARASDPAGFGEGQRLAQAYLQLMEGVVSFERFELDPAERALGSAQKELARLGNPYALRARLYLALCLYQRAGYEGALKALGEVAGAARVIPDPFALGYALHGRGSTLDSMLRPLDALTEYEDALASYREAGWDGRAAGIEGLIAGIQSSLGQDELAWEHRVQALANSGWISDPRTRIRVWSEATTAADRTGGPKVARFFADELVRVADDEEEAILKAIALRKRAAVLYASGHRAEALADLSAASEWIDQIADRTVAEMSRVDLVLVRGELLAENEPALALATLEEAKRLFEATRYTSMFPRMLHARSRAHRALGEVEDAEADLDAALGAVQVALSRLPNAVARMTYAGQVRPLYDEALALAEVGGRVRRGILYTERFRSALLTQGRTADLDVMLEAADEVPPSKAVLVFHLLPDRLLVWILRTGSLRLVSVPVGADELTAQIRVFRRALASGGEWRPMAEKLFEELFGPLGDEIEGAEDLVVIPDGAIDGLPLAALVNEESGRFLVEEFRISTSPLLSIALGAQRTQRFGGFDASTAVLAVANPWQSRSSATLLELPFAEMEVERISGLFSRTTILRGRAATKERFLAEAQRSSIIHFAGHSVANPRLPLLSSLILSPGAEGSSGQLHVYELLDHRLEAPRLVVLSACSSRIGGAAFTSLTDAVVAAGVPVAVGSLWNIADRPSAAFFERFYSELREGAEPIEALRATQLSLLRSSNSERAHPSTWAAFQASGVDRTEPRR